MELFIDVIDYYILHRLGLEVTSWDSYNTLIDFITGYHQKVEIIMEKMNLFLLPNSSTNFNRAYMNLVLEAERYYPEFNIYMNQVIKEELQCWECILTRAKEKEEIKSTLNVSLLAKLFNNIYFGKSFQDTLECGLKIEKLKDLFYYQGKVKLPSQGMLH